MVVVAIPLFLILFVVVGIGAGISKALQVNIMPFISIMCALFAIIGAVNAFRCEESRKVHIALAVISGLLFLFTLGSSMTSGDILSWIWYHI